MSSETKGPNDAKYSFVLCGSLANKHDTCVCMWVSVTHTSIPYVGLYEKNETVFFSENRSQMELEMKTVGM